MTFVEIVLLKIQYIFWGDILNIVALITREHLVARRQWNKILSLPLDVSAAGNIVAYHSNVLL